MALLNLGSSAGDLQDYLDSVRRRLRAAVASRGLGALTLTALFITVVGVFIANRFAFSTASIVSVRTLLFAAIAAVIALLLVRPLRGLGARKAADEAERQAPAFGGRLETWVDQTARIKSQGLPRSPLLDLLRDDALRVAEAVPVDDVVGGGRILSYATAGLAGLLTFIHRAAR